MLEENWNTSKKFKKKTSGRENELMSIMFTVLPKRMTSQRTTNPASEITYFC